MKAIVGNFTSGSPEAFVLEGKGTCGCGKGRGHVSGWFGMWKGGGKSGKEGGKRHGNSV